MGRPVLILLAGGRDDDVELVAQTLRSSGFDPDIIRVLTRTELVAQFDRHVWDSILCYQGSLDLPLEEVAEIVRVRRADVPFICVTGAIGEERAADLLRCGVSDIVLKQPTMPRLGLALNREMAQRTARRKSAEATGRAGLVQLERDVVNPPAIVYQRVLHPDGRIRYPVFWGGLIDELGLAPDTRFEDISEEMVASDDRAIFLSAFAKSASDISRLAVDLRLKDASQHLRWLSTTATTRKMPDGSIVWDGVLVDITKRRTVEERARLVLETSLEISKATDFTTALENVLQQVCQAAEWPCAEAWIANPATDELVCGAIWDSENPNWSMCAARSRPVTVSSRAGLIGEAWSERRSIWTTDIRAHSIHGEFAELLQTANITSEYAVPICASDKVLAVLLFRVPRLFEYDPRWVEAISMIAKQLGIVLARMVVDESLREKLTMLQSAQEFAKLGSWVGHISPVRRLEGSPEIYRMHGIREGTFDHQRASYLEMVDARDREAVASAISRTVETGAPYEMEYRIVRPNGEVRWVHSRGRLETQDTHRGIRIVGVMQDTTDTRSAREQLVHAQKMEAVGRLAGGMAHDFNNILSIIIGNIDLLRAPGNSLETVDELSLEARDAAFRGAELTRGLLAYARHGTLEERLTDLNELTGRIVKLLARTLGEDIEISFYPAENLWPVLADQAQIESAIANLATNARDAMPKGGRLTIRTTNCRVENNQVAYDTALKPGEYAVIEVTDTGIGIPPEKIEQIFEPFFTTKELGKGTGLGLSMVFGFFKQSGGHVTVHSEVGCGSTFRLYLPRSFAHEAAETAPVPAKPLRGRGETVLAVEDNVDLRRVVVRQLRALGYRVAEAANAEEAIAILETQTVSLLFSDIVMPGPLNGIDLAHRTAESWPSVKIILASGYSETRLKPGQLGHEVRLIAKPYSSDELADALLQVLGE
jgi:PAS domain S-box-containing protein